MGDSEKIIKRIMVALDASPSSYTNMEIAVALAAGFGAELCGVFVEDINLIKVTKLPFGEVSLFSPVVPKIDTEQIERQFRVQSNHMREALAASADRKGVNWSFKVVRGSVSSALLEAGADADLLIIGRIGRSLSGPKYLGSTVRTVIIEREGQTLILQRGTTEWGAVPAIMIYDGSDLAVKALETAVGLTQIRGGSLRVIILGDDENSARRLQQDVIDKLHSAAVQASYRLIIQPDLNRVFEAVKSEGPGPLILPCEKGPTGEEELCSLINEIPNPVLLVR